MYNYIHSRRRKFLLLALSLLLAAALLVSCSDAGGRSAAPPGGEKEDPGEGGADIPEEPAEEIDYEALGVNEAGRIMILMYHEIGEPEDVWCRTPDNFRKDLEALYEAGYRLISMNDLLDGHIDVPAGCSPVVLTFDDGNAGQFRYIEKDGRLVIDPDCAVAILEEFYAAHPDFGLAATFYIYYDNPFRQQEYVQQKLQYLVEIGFEIGSHCYTHGVLSRLSPEEARRELGMHVKRTQEYLPGYIVRSLALPKGERPKDISYVIEGSYEGTPYRHEGILLVGAEPAPSPFTVKFDPSALPRVRASEIDVEGYGLYDWLERLQNNPQLRYVSDGDPNTVVVPEELAEQIDRFRLGSRTLIPY
ncbi:MAG: polysaccharide deacetylase family protein [Firmicutes bacterium]|nr:polysaccharide deacetylase family protein [Bacillota bacterium]